MKISIKLGIFKQNETFPYNKIIIEQEFGMLELKFLALYTTVKISICQLFTSTNVRGYQFGLGIFLTIFNQIFTFFKKYLITSFQKGRFSTYSSQIIKQWHQNY